MGEKQIFKIYSGFCFGFCRFYYLVFHKHFLFIFSILGLINTLYIIKIILFIHKCTHRNTPIYIYIYIYMYIYMCVCVCVCVCVFVSLCIGVCLFEHVLYDING